MADKKDDKVRRGKVLPPEKKSRGDTNIHNTLIANIDTRPDLMLEVFEQNDPGFTKRVSERLESELKSMHSAKFWFGAIQAYAGLAAKTIIALVLCPILMYLVITSDTGAKFWLLMALIVFFAVSQSGNSGFTEITKALAQWITKGIKGNNRDD